MVKHPVRTLLLTLMAIPFLAIIMVIGIELLSGGSASGTLSTGRTVTTYSDSIYLSSTFSPNTATIQTGGHTIVVEPEELIVNGANVGKINPKSAAVEVRVNRGKITFVADGKPVTTTLR